MLFKLFKKCIVQILVVSANKVYFHWGNEKHNKEDSTKNAIYTV